MKREDQNVQNAFKHGLTNSGAYKSWQAMKRRCLDPKHPHYKNYGARDITVTDKWLNFRGFYEDMGDRPPGHTIDRINNDLGYIKENCRWIPATQQNYNRRTNKIITIRNEQHHLNEWARIVGISDSTIRRRLKAGWDTEEAVLMPPIPRSERRWRKE